MDWIRSFYYLFMVHTGLADTYRNEQFFPKSDYFYDYERTLIAINFANPDTSKVARNLIVQLHYPLKQILPKWSKDEEIEEEKE
jgi:hypothetical protein